MIPLSSAMDADYLRVQARADAVAQAHGDSAPRWLDGERLNDYRQRLLGPFKKFSPTWRDADLSKIHDEGALRAIEAAVYADAMAEAEHPTSLSLRPGQLVERVSTDRSGRRISRFYGDPEVTWGPFKSPGRRIRNINRPGAQ